MNNVHLAIQFFIQLAVILLFCRLVGAIALRLGQPQVVAEMLTPFVLGAGLAWILFDHTALFPTTTSRSEAMLFLGASMCITAFPMLARIIHFKKLTGTTMGTVALGAGAID